MYDYAVNMVRSIGFFAQSEYINRNSQGRKKSSAEYQMDIFTYCGVVDC